MSDRHDWSNPIVPRVDALDVYLNKDGDVVIRQQHWPEEDAVVIVPADYAAKVAEAIAMLVAPEPPNA